MRRDYNREIPCSYVRGVRLFHYLCYVRLLPNFDTLHFAADCVCLSVRHKWRLRGYYCYLIFRKITKFVATRCHILRLNAPNSILAGASPTPRWGSLQRSPYTLAEFKGVYFQRKGWGMGGGREGKGRKVERKGRREGKGGREDKEWGAYQDEAPLTKIVNAPLYKVIQDRRIGTYRKGM